jgi:hypothetical protein
MVILVENKPEEVIDKEKQSNEDEQWEINEKNTIRQLQRKRGRRVYQ